MPTLLAVLRREMEDRKHRFDDRTAVPSRAIAVIASCSLPPITARLDV